MGQRKLHRTLSWGATRTETWSDENGDITLQTAESADMTSLAEAVEKFVLDNTDHVRESLADSLLEDSWLLGYTFGACVACVSSSGGSGDTSLVGFASRVCGELLGGGIDRKVAAYDALQRHAMRDDFDQGRRAAIGEWVA